MFVKDFREQYVYLNGYKLLREEKILNLVYILRRNKVGGVEFNIMRRDGGIMQKDSVIFVDINYLNVVLIQVREGVSSNIEWFRF